MIHYERIEIVSELATWVNVKATFDENPDKVLMIPVDESNSDYQTYLASLEEDQAQTATI